MRIAFRRSLAAATTDVASKAYSLGRTNPGQISRARLKIAPALVRCAIYQFFGAKKQFSGAKKQFSGAKKQFSGAKKQKFRRKL